MTDRFATDSRIAIWDRLTRIVSRIDEVDEPLFHECRMAYLTIPQDAIEELDGDMWDSFEAFVDALAEHGVLEDDLLDAEGALFPHRDDEVVVL